MILLRHLPVWGGALVCLVLWQAFAAAPGEQAPDSVPVKRGPIVDAPAGKIEGQLDGNMRVFKGIPYALPPVGQARWKPPSSDVSMGGGSKGDGIRPGMLSTDDHGPDGLHARSTADERGLSDAEYLGARRRSQRAGLFLDIRRCADRLERAARRCTTVRGWRRKALSWSRSTTGWACSAGSRILNSAPSRRRECRAITGCSIRSKRCDGSGRISARSAGTLQT